MKTARIAPSRRFFALSTASGLAMSAMIATPAIAQDAEDEGGPVEAAQADDGNVIVVQGFRASLENAQNIKRDADTFVDAVTAEDIGALPDRSVAETLQRIPGVNIGRFEKPTDPDRFSVEGTGVIVRGLPFVRSELNGRDIFSATGGRTLSFNDVSPELLGRVEVFKNVTADMIDGGIAGTVNLVTRKPLDNPGTRLSGSVEGNYGDLREEWSPGFSILGSTVYESPGGSQLGVQLAYSRNELKSRTDASQITDPCYRDPALNDSCIRALTVGSGGFVGEPNFDASNFPPAGAVLTPQAAGVRTTDLDREREAWSAVLQYEDPTGNFVATFEWLRSDTTFETEEFALLGRIDDGVAFPVQAPGSTWQFDSNGQFVSGVLTQPVIGGPNSPARTPQPVEISPFGGVPLDSLRFLRDTDSTTEDFSFDVKWNVTDRLRVNFEAQSISSDLARDSVFGAMSTWADIAIDASGKTPQIEFLAPSGVNPTINPSMAPADYFSSGFYTYYWFGLDSREKNEGDLESLRFDVEYDISDTGFFKSARFGARWAERDRTTRNTNFSTWGNLSAPWAGRAGCAPWGEGPGCQPGAPGTTTYDWNGNGVIDGGDGFPGFFPGRFFNNALGTDPASGLVRAFPGVTNAFDGAAGGAYTDDFPAFSRIRNPFGDGFQRGKAPTPIPNGEAWFYGGDDFLEDYLNGEIDGQWDQITNFSQSPERFNLGVNGRFFTDPLTGETVPCDIEGVYCPGEVSTVTEVTNAAYARIDFGHDFSNGWNVEGNIGLRYVETEVSTTGRIGFPDPGRFDAPVLDGAGNQVGGGNGDGIVQVSEIEAACVVQAGPDRGFCDSRFASRLAEFAAVHTGEVLIDDRTITFDHWLPSFNVKLDVGDGLLFRGAVSKGISRPDLQLFRAGGGIFDNTAALLAANNLESGPAFALETGNRNIRPIESWNYDLSAEWYFDDVGSLTASVFLKDIQGFIDTGFTLVDYTSPSGVTAEVNVKGPSNQQDGNLYGFEVTYQQTFDFLPGLLGGLGAQFTYTYVNGDDFSNPTLSDVGQSSITTSTNELNSGAFVAQQPLAGISEHTINATIFYEKGPISARAAYNWRSEYLITPRDDIFPFSPIWQDDTGQLDASIFYSVTDYLKLGVQGVNLLDEVTTTSQVVDFDGTRITRSAFRNDRRFTFLARFDF
ncbi:TonB-dependent receptor domain-containing protein [Erythrobacter sp. THAF29]|uniref:TonB-dependent receptor domain-containing protein n=1 Tax=Erythrobacter sp. THAF29 TaxID=2587851 RepID=UPI001267FB09|nr:TonB-dependent receptor [Erythrobacter sp. THAF29]QFT78861.1 TonB dependent receptor [Erythrobacter sp. THAF29]